MSLSIRALADQFYAFMSGRKAARTVDYYRSFIERWIAHVGDVPLEDLRKHHLLLWAHSWHQQQAVQRLFEWARNDAELIAKNPFHGMKLPRPRNRQRIVTDREFAELLKAAKVDFRRFLLAMRESIARPQEIRAVKWEWIRWDGPYADVRAALVMGEAYFELWEYKARTLRADPNTPRRILINARLGRLLVWLARGRGELLGEVFRNSRGERWTANAVRCRMRRLITKVGIEPDDRGERIVAYSMRHTAATNAIIKGASTKVVAELMGHTSSRTTERYCHLSKAHLRQAMKGIWTHPQEGQRFPD